MVITVIGEALVDIVDGVPHPGGSPVNVAVGLGRLGNAVSLLTRFGPDEHGDLLAVYESHRGGTVKPAVVIAPWTGGAAPAVE